MKPIQISTQKIDEAISVIALCDNGSVWFKANAGTTKGWQPLPPIPGTNYDDSLDDSLTDYCERPD